MPEAIIYPPNLKTDKEKLFACYRIIEQMRIEHNKQVAIARNKPDIYLKTGKFRAYAHESKLRLKQLLAEQNRLRDKIRWANYTREQWRALGYSPNEFEPIYLSIWGDKEIERIKPTKATSPLLDELRAISLDDLTPSFGSDPTQNLLTYTEEEPDNIITTTADRGTFTNLDSDFDAYLYDDKGSAHFDGNYEILYKVYLTAIGASGGAAYVGMLTNDVDDGYGLYFADKDFLGTFFFRTDATYRLYLRECDGGDITDDYGSISTATTYFIEFERDEAVGDYGTIYAYISTSDYWDDGGDQVDTLTVTLNTSKKDFQYFFAINSSNSGSSDRDATGWIELIDLQEVVVYIPRHGFVNFQDPGIV